MSDPAAPSKSDKVVIRNAKPKADVVLAFAIGGVIAIAVGLWGFSESDIFFGIIVSLIGAFCLFMAIAFTIKGNDRSPQFTLSRDKLVHHPSGFAIAWDEMINLRWEKKVLMVDGAATGATEAKIYIQSKDEPEMETALNVYALELTPEELVAKIREWVGSEILPGERFGLRSGPSIQRRYRVTTTGPDGSDERVHHVEGASRDEATAFALLSGLIVTKIEELPEE